MHFRYRQSGLLHKLQNLLTVLQLNSGTDKEGVLWELSDDFAYFSIKT